MASRTTWWEFSPSRTAPAAGVINQLQFVDEYGLGDAYLSNYVKNVLAVTPEQVQQIMVKYLDPSKMTITVVGDKKTVEPQLEPYRAGVP